MKLDVKGHEVDISDGTIKLEINGEIIGTANYGCKHGYHPCVLLEVGDNREWFELDTKDITQKIVDKAYEFYTDGKCSYHDCEKYNEDVEDDVVCPDCLQFVGK